MKRMFAGLDRQKKALLLLPLMILPFITLAFWALGGGANNGGIAMSQNSGLNLSLPEANNKSKSALDKLRFYEAADKDSVEWRRQLAQDRYSLGYRDEIVAAPGSYPNNGFVYDPAPPYSSNSSAETERLIYQKLGEINNQVTTVEKRPVAQRGFDARNAVPPLDDYGSLQMHRQSPEGAGSDSELVALNQMMEKILDIQHPERIKKEVSVTDSPANGEQVFKVSLHQDSRIAYFGRKVGVASTGENFYSAGNLTVTATQEPGLRASISEQQVVRAGSVVQLRLVRQVYLKDIAIPAGTMVYGMASLQEDRLMIAIPGIVFNERIYPVSLKVYDLDGMEGISMPASPSRKIVTESMGNSFQSIPMLSIDPSVKAQAATAGVQAVKSLVGRKVREVKVVLPAGYQVILHQSK